MNNKKRKLLTAAFALTACLVLQSGVEATAQEKQDSSTSIADKIFTSVEVMPVPPFDVNRYLAENIVYPDDAKKRGIQGRVVIQFVVDKDGSITNIVVVREIGGGCGLEAMRVVRNMPRWTPGKINGQAVRVYYTLPISFKLANY